MPGRTASCRCETLRVRPKETGAQRYETAVPIGIFRKPPPDGVRSRFLIPEVDDHDANAQPQARSRTIFLTRRGVFGEASSPSIMV